MQPLGESFREAIGQRLDHDRRVIVIGVLEAVGDVVLADAGRDHEGADMIRLAASSGATKSTIATLERPSRRAICWRSECSVAICFLRASS